MGARSARGLPGRDATFDPVPEPLITLLCGFGIALVTTPVGVSGAVFLLPVQLDLLKVPNPSVTPTNLLYNVVAGPGALLRHRARLRSSLVGRLLCGTVPGVVVGACVSGSGWSPMHGRSGWSPPSCSSRWAAGWWFGRSGRAPPRAPPRHRAPPPWSRCRSRSASSAACTASVAGSILAPILVGRGMRVADVAPAALASTFVTSVAGAITFAVIAQGVDGSIAPDWPIGLAAGVGGLAGGYLGARWSHLAPERALRLLLGAVAIAVA